jgi:hypothetical protein
MGKELFHTNGQMDIQKLILVFFAILRKRQKKKAIRTNFGTLLSLFVIYTRWFKYDRDKL